MVQKVIKKGYFVHKGRLRIIVLLIILALCILITAFIATLVYSNKTKYSKSSQTSEKYNNNENKKYQNFANDFESDPKNKSRAIFDKYLKISKFLDLVLIKKLVINSSVLQLKAPKDGNIKSQVDVDFTEGKFITFKLETLLNYWEWMEMLNIGEIKALVEPEPEQANHTIILGKQFVTELCDYDLRMILLKEFYDKYRVEYGDKAQNNVLFSHIITFIHSLKVRLFPLIFKIRIEIDEFKEWQSEKKNKLALVFLNKFQHIVLGLPLFMIFHLITELNTTEIPNTDEQNYGQYKPLLARLINTDIFTKEQVDVIKGKFYKLFSILEMQEIRGNATEDEPGKIDVAYELLQLLDDDLKNFLVVYKKI